MSQVSELSQNSFMNAPLFRWLQGTVGGGLGFRFSGWDGHGLNSSRAEAQLEPSAKQSLARVTSFTVVWHPSCGHLGTELVS